MFSTSEKIEILLSRKGLKKIELAEYLQTSPGNVTSRLLRNSYREMELQNIAKFLGCILDVRFKNRETGDILSSKSSSIELIRIIINREGLTMSKFASMINTKQSNLSSKFKRGNLSQDDIITMADVLGYDVEFIFCDPSSDTEI